MICQPCQEAAHHNKLQELKRAQKLHSDCEGDCGCQHRTGPGWFVKVGERAPAMRTQSP